MSEIQAQCHILIAFIRYLYIMILSCIQVMKYGHMLRNLNMGLVFFAFTIWLTSLLSPNRISVFLYSIYILSPKLTSSAYSLRSNPYWFSWVFLLMYPKASSKGKVRVFTFETTVNKKCIRQYFETTAPDTVQYRHSWRN
jgi:hypothetical protein